MTTPDQQAGNPPVDLLWILAHPDDESFGASGTMAWADSVGLRTAYVCATRGEAGQIRLPRLATRDSLGAVREHELRRAVAAVGLHELRLLGFRDSGMEGDPDNDDPRALIRQSPEEVLTHLVGHIRDLRPRTVVTFGPEGVYGHPDHVAIGKLAVRAVALAADETWLPDLYTPWRADALYFSAAPRERMIAMIEDPDGPLQVLSETARANLGTPTADITHWLDITPFLTRKRAALAQHATQVNIDEMWPVNDAEAPLRFATEQYFRQPLPWDGDAAHDDALDRAVREIGLKVNPFLESGNP